MSNKLFDYKLVEKLLHDSREILIGISGGKDSIAMLHQILQYREKLNKNFKVLHVDHQLNDQSDNWAQFVKNYCEDNGVPVTIIKVDVEKERNLELAARKARYAAYSQQDFDTLLLGHHASDQLETFFMKLFRGAGVKGLKCMSYTAPCWFDTTKKIIRPMLDKTRFDIDNYAADNNLPYVDDPSNRDLRFDRNWVRHALVPMITERNSISDINILKSISIQSETFELMNDLAEIDYNTCKTNIINELNWMKLRSLSLPRLKNLVMNICSNNNLIDVSTHNVEQFCRGILNSDEDSKNELRIRNFRMQKIGKIVRIFYAN